MFLWVKQKSIMRWGRSKNTHSKNAHTNDVIVAVVVLVVASKPRAMGGSTVCSVVCHARRANREIFANCRKDALLAFLSCTNMQNAIAERRNGISEHSNGARAS